MLPVWYEKAKELFLKGYTYKKIGEELSVDRKQVSYYLKLNNYISKPIMKHNDNVYRKYTFNEDFFEIIDTEQKAYWLGFLMADGYVSEKKSSIELGLKESDKLHLEKFKKDISSNHVLSKTKKNLKGTEYIGYRLTLNSAKLKQDLIDKGCTPRKTLRLEFPNYNIVPKHLMYHFIRGYVDADGCITNIKKMISLEVVGTREFLEQYIKELELHENKIHYINNRKTASRIIYSGSYAVNIINKLYTNASIYLDRKYALVKHLLPS